MIKRLLNRHGIKSDVKDPKRGVRQLIVALKDRHAAVRRGAAEALGDVGDQIAVEPLISALNDGDFETRLQAIIALGKIGDARAVEPLIAKLKDDRDYFYVRKKAAYTLYTFYKKESLDGDLKSKIRSHWRSWYLT